MNRQVVTSSNIKSVGYDKQTQTLEIEFKNGGIFHYHSVPQHVYESMLQDKSIGSYLHNTVKKYYKATKQK